MENVLKSQTKLTPEQAAAIGLVSEMETANRLGLSVSTLQNWRRNGRGPLSYQINEQDFMYLDHDVETFETLCLDSFHALNGSGSPKQIGWCAQSDRSSIETTRATTNYISFKEWLEQQESVG